MDVTPARWKIWTALLTIYLVWGSTYLAIKIAVRTQPPLLSSGTRFITAGLVLAAVVVMTRRSLRVSRRELASSLASSRAGSGRKRHAEYFRPNGSPTSALRRSN